MAVTYIYFFCFFGGVCFQLRGTHVGERDRVIRLFKASSGDAIVRGSSS